MWYDDKTGMENIIVDYFTQVFKSQGSNEMSKVLDAIKPRVTKEMNDELLLPFTDEEIKFALFQMHPTKASGPDGMTPGFTKNIGGLWGKMCVWGCIRCFPRDYAW